MEIIFDKQNDKAESQQKLVEAGEVELSESDLDKATGGCLWFDVPDPFTPPSSPDLPNPLDYPTIEP